jgi:exopolysaccharide biosynthesis WecB/TagA/CpsF family protein
MTQELFGVQLSRLNLEETARRIVTAAGIGLPMCVSSLAVHGLVCAARNPSFRAVVNAFDLLGADGHPVRWLLNLTSKNGLSERVCGTDLMALLCDRCATNGVGIYLYGSTHLVVEDLAGRLEERYPALVICGAEPSTFRDLDLSAEDDAALIERINSSGAGIVFLGLGCPLQECFAHAHRESIKPVQVCVGAAFDFLSGNKTRAPKWMQRHWLEWLYRLLQEPRRLGLRYLETNTLFVWLTLRRLLQHDTKQR